MSRLTRPRRALVALVAGCCLFALVANGTAAADSLVFVKDNNVWLANPDGSGQYQVTLDGSADNPYQSPSQADDGTIVAARKQPNGGPLYRMKQNGELLGTVPVGALIAGPFNPQVSPDGRTVAFEQVFSRNVNGYIETSTDVRFTRTDGSTPNGMGEVGRGAGAPSWIDSGRAFVGMNQVATTVVPGQEPVEWWSDYDHQPVYFSLGETVEDGEVAPNGNIAVVRGEHDDNTIQLYRSTGGFTALPTPTCTLTEPSPGPAGKKFADPTFSPSGDAIAWQEGDGVWTESVPENCAEGKPHLLIAGASEPDWGPADVNPGPRQPSHPPFPPGPDPKPKPKDDDRRQLRAALVPTSLGKALAKGFKVRFQAPAAGTATAAAKVNRRPIAAGSQRVAGPGAGVVTVRFAKSVKAALRSVERVRLELTVRFAPRGGGKPATQQLPVVLKR
ncbi:MAG TPA: hypothetical protein VHA54_10835 [Solirubrobacterales bacterium]|nr:hypothetical protein [Solirubrobacterales bacterium]